MNKEEKRIERIAELAARKKTWIYAEYDGAENEIRGHGSRSPRRDCLLWPAKS